MVYKRYIDKQEENIHPNHVRYKLKKKKKSVNTNKDEVGITKEIYTQNRMVLVSCANFDMVTSDVFVVEYFK